MTKPTPPGGGGTPPGGGGNPSIIPSGEFMSLFIGGGGAARMPP